MADVEQVTSSATKAGSDASSDAAAITPTPRIARWQIGVGVFTAVLAFLGSTGGVLLSNRQQMNQWERNSRYELEKMVLERRLELIERTCKTFNKSGMPRVWNAEVDARYKEAQAEIAQFLQRRDSRRRSSDLDAKLKSSTDTALANTERLIQFGADSSAVLSLDMIYFGPKTRGCIREVLKHRRWWEASKSELSAVLTAMCAELTYRADSLSGLQPKGDVLATESYKPQGGE